MSLGMRWEQHRTFPAELPAVRGGWQQGQTAHAFPASQPNSWQLGSCAPWKFGQVGDHRRPEYTDCLPTGLLEDVVKAASCHQDAYCGNLSNPLAPYCYAEPRSGISSTTASSGFGGSSLALSSGSAALSSRGMGGSSMALTRSVGLGPMYAGGVDSTQLASHGTKLRDVAEERKVNGNRQATRGHKPRLNVDAVLSDRITSLMIHNLPMSLTQDNVRDELDHSGFASLYDFLYVPYNLKTSSICGYAFINLVSHDAAALLVNMWDQRSTLCGAATDRFVFFSAADVQGYEAHVERLTKGSKRCLRDPRFRPVLRRGQSSPAANNQNNYVASPASPQASAAPSEWDSRSTHTMGTGAEEELQEGHLIYL
mmetsp:Transcript_6092/g.14576  ORF Transcript_6092/g.14576 Transcript_6092/m.14576 type:complete len:369 (-) Transcript_6092:269-1375(-)